MSNQVNSLKKGLTVKDLVTTGIFSAIFFVFTLVGGLPFAPNPVLTFYMPMGAALLCGPIYLLMVAKVQKRWSVTILGIIMGIIWFATGMHWAFSLGYIGMGLIADLVAGAGHYRNKAINLLSYSSPCGAHIPASWRQKRGCPAELSPVRPAPSASPAGKSEEYCIGVRRCWMAVPA